MGNVVRCSNNVNWDFNQELRYILCPKRQVEALRRRTDELKATRDVIQGEVDEIVRQRQGVIMHPQVEIWMDSVNKLVTKVDTTTTPRSRGDLSFLQRLCCCYSRYELGEQIYQMLDEITRLEGQHKDTVSKNLTMDVSPVIDLQSKLKDEMEQLRATKMDVESKVSGLEREAVHPLMVRSELVNLWIKNVNSHDTEVSNLIATIESATPHVWATKHSELEVEIQRMRGEIKSLSVQTEKLERNGLVVMAPPEQIHELPGPSEDIVVGFDEKLEEVLGWLDDDSIELIGIHGMGGAGKTTLVKEVTKKLRSSGDGGSFELVISVVVSQNLDIKKIQEEIVIQLGYKRNSLPYFQHERDGANFIWDKLCQKSFLLVLDDVWQPFDMSEVGFRSSTKKMEEKKIKVMITSRSEDACASMVGSIHPPKILKVGFLREDHAWELFRRKIRNDLIEFEEIRRLAKQIVRKCGGLPLVLKAIASAMAKNKTESDWVHAKSQLDHYSSDIREMKHVYERLRFSFDRLSEELKSCLLYCAMFPEDTDISIKQVIGYWIVEGFLDIKVPFDFDRLCWKARSDIIWRLQESSLLEKGSRDEEYFKLHDAVRDMVIWLGEKATEGNEQYKLLTRAGEGLNSSIRVDESWVGVKMVSLMWNDIKEVLVLSDGISSEALHVQTLLMYRNNARHLRENLFPLLSSLRILDLSFTQLQEIPKSIGSLKLLRYLNVSFTAIKEIPVEIGNLTNLHTLDLSYNRDLSYIPRLAISPIKMLRFLYLESCPCFEYKEEGKLTLVDLNGLPRLIDVRLNVYHAGDVERLLESDTLSMSTSTLWFRGIHDVTINTIEYMQRLEELNIKHCKFLFEELELNGNHLPKLNNLYLCMIKGLRNIVLTSPMLYLQRLVIGGCEFEHLTWLQQLPNLKRLNLYTCSHLRELLLKQELGGDNDERSSHEPLLSHMTGMQLNELPLLESISSGNMLFPSLTFMKVHGCPKLRKLPIKLCNSVRTWIECDMDWWESLEWGDEECNPSRFDPELYEASPSSSPEV